MLDGIDIDIDINRGGCMIAESVLSHPGPPPPPRIKVLARTLSWRIMECDATLVLIFVVE